MPAPTISSAAGWLTADAPGIYAAVDAGGITVPCARVTNYLNQWSYDVLAKLEKPHHQAFTFLILC